MTQCCLRFAKSFFCKYIQMFVSMISSSFSLLQQLATTHKNVMMTRRLTSITTITTKQWASNGNDDINDSKQGKNSNGNSSYVLSRGRRQSPSRHSNPKFDDDRFLLLLPWSLVACSTENFIPLWIISLQSPRPKTREIAGHKPRRVKLSRRGIYEWG